MDKSDKEIEAWEYLASTLTYEHQQSVKRDVLSYVEILKQLKNK